MTPLLSLQLPHATRSTEHTVSNRENLPVIKATFALSASEALIVPLSAECLDILADDRKATALAFGGAALSTLGLAINAPGVAVLLNVCHAMLKGFTALGTKEVAVVKVVA